MYCLAYTAPPVSDPAAGFSPEAYRWYALRICVTAPLMEELGCRWLAFGKLRRCIGFWPAALASAAVFGLLHVDISPRRRSKTSTTAT